MNIWLRLGLFLLVVVSVGDSALAREDLWLSDEGGVKIVANVSASSEALFACSGVWGHFDVKDVGIVMGCAYGIEVQAIVYDNRGLRLAMKYPHETRAFSVENVCRSGLGCQYGEDADVLIERVYGDNMAVNALVYRDFVARLQRVGGSYDYIGPAPHRVVGTDDIPLRVGSVGLSQNGKWAAIELYEKGTAIVNTRDGTHRRVAAPGYSYGLGRNPVERLAVSNDGRRVFVTGRNAGFHLYERREGCGDDIASTADKAFAPDVAPCPSSDAGIAEVTGGLLYGRDAYFIDEASALVVVIENRLGQIRRLTIRPTSTPDLLPATYVAMGDSFSSGEGELDSSFYLAETDTNVNRCHISTRSYPFLAAQQALVRPSVKSVACSGAVTVDVFGFATGQAITAFREQPAFVSLGIGGNDVGLIDKLKRCLMPDTCDWTTPSMRGVIFEEIERLGLRLTGLYRELVARLPGSRVFAIGYPDAVVVEGVCDPITGILLNKDERQMLHESLRRLNATIRWSAATAGVEFIDFDGAYGPHGLCGSATPAAMNALRTGDDIAPLPMLDTWRFIGAESFHPTPYGHERVAKRLSTAFDRRACICVEPSAEPPSEYWHQRTIPASVWLRQRLTAPEISPGNTFQLKTDAHIFSAGTQAIARLNSKPVDLGAFTVDGHGAATGTAVIPPDIAEGFHTLTITGESPSGDSVTLYQTVAVKTPQLKSAPNGEKGSAVDVRAGRAALSTSTSEVLSSRVAKLNIAASEHALLQDRSSKTPQSAFWVMTFLSLLVLTGIILLWLLFAHLLRK